MNAEQLAAWNDPRGQASSYATCPDPDCTWKVRYPTPDEAVAMTQLPVGSITELVDASGRASHEFVESMARWHVEVDHGVGGDPMEWARGKLSEA